MTDDLDVSSALSGHLAHAHVKPRPVIRRIVSKRPHTERTVILYTVLVRNDAQTLVSLYDGMLYDVSLVSVHTENSIVWLYRNGIAIPFRYNHTMNSVSVDTLLDIFSR